MTPKDTQLYLLSALVTVGEASPCSRWEQIQTHNWKMFREWEIVTVSPKWDIFIKPQNLEIFSDI